MPETEQSKSVVAINGDDVRQLTDVAKIVRSKNAGPRLITFDIIFEDKETFESIVQERVLSPSIVAEALNIETSSIVSWIEVPSALALKFNVARSVIQGSRGDADIYGAAQHAPLLTISVPSAVPAATTGG